MSESRQQLEQLLADPGYSRTIELLTREVMNHWNYTRDAARSTVLSAIGDPPTLASIYQAWLLGKAGTGAHPRLAAVISRRRVIDLLGRDARRAKHHSMSTAADELDAQHTPDALRTTEYDAHTQLECRELEHLIRDALGCFGAKGTVQKRQADLLQRRMLDERSYRELAAELDCNENALRVRVHAALKALYRHILWCHPELVAGHPSSIAASSPR